MALTDEEIRQTANDEVAVDRICNSIACEGPVGADAKGVIYNNILIPADQIYALKRYMKTLRKLLSMDTESVFQLALRIKQWK